MKTSFASALALALITTTAATARAEPLGQVGQLAIAGDFQVAITSTSSDADGDESTTNITIAPAADFFIFPNLSVGGQLVFARQSEGDDSAQALGLGARVGYVIGLGKISIWPRVGLTFARTTLDGEGDGDVTFTDLTFNLFAPLLFHPVDHFFIGAGPALDYDLVADSDIEGADIAKNTSIGIISTVGGYF